MVMRTQYWTLSTGTVRSGSTTRAESVTDVERSLLPLDRARGVALHTWGVGAGLTLRATAGEPGVTITAGTALDAAGRTIVLEAGGFAVVDPTVDPAQVEGVPTVAVPADGLVLATALPADDYILTLTWREVEDAGPLGNAPVLLHAPWVRLVPQGDFDDDGAQVGLGLVSVDEGGVVADLTDDGRRPAGLPAGDIELRCPRVVHGTPTAVDHVVVASIAGRGDGGLAVRARPPGGPSRPALSVDATGQVNFPSGLGVRADATGRTYRLSTDPGNGRLRVTDVAAGVDRLVVDAAGNVGLGPLAGGTTLERPLHVEGHEIHSGGFSFSDRATPAFVNFPDKGQRWVWYSLNRTAHLWSGGAGNVVSIDAHSEGGALDVSRRMRVRRGGTSSAGIWLWDDDRLGQGDPGADKAFVGMAEPDQVGFWGNTGAAWGLRVNTTTGFVTMKKDFGQPAGPSTLWLWGSRIADTGGGRLSIGSGGSIVTFNDGDNVGIGTADPLARLDVRGVQTAVRAIGGNGAFHAGVHGEGNIGVWAVGRSTGLLASSSNLAGSFWGNVRITGELSKGGGGFKIDHPLDPSNRYLSHSFVEGPDRLNLYVGAVVTGDDGRAVVDLPDYFEALNRDPQYQLTPVVEGGEVAIAVVDGEVTGNRFGVRTDRPGVKVSWMVTAVRRDAWAEAHPLLVEEDKTDDERELFLHPDVLGEPEEKSLINLLQPPAGY